MGVPTIVVHEVLAIEDLGEDQDAWAKNAKDRRFWARKRLAHLWETGWDDASFNTWFNLNSEQQRAPALDDPLE